MTPREFEIRALRTIIVLVPTLTYVPGTYYRIRVGSCCYRYVACTSGAHRNRLDDLRTWLPGTVESKLA